MCIKFCLPKELLGKHIVQHCLSYSAHSSWSSRKTNRPWVWGLLKCLSWAIDLCSLWRLCSVADIDLLPKTAIYHTQGVIKTSPTHKNNSADGIPEAPAKKCWQKESNGLFPSLALMPNEGTRVHCGNPQRRELIPPGGNSRNVKYVSWYLREATLSGFTYRNSQWDGDSFQCLLDFTLCRDVIDTKRLNDRSCHLPFFDAWRVSEIKEKSFFNRRERSTRLILKCFGNYYWWYLDFCSICGQRR